MPHQQIAANIGNLRYQQRGRKDRQHRVTAYDVAIVRKDNDAGRQRRQVADDSLGLRRWICEINSNKETHVSLDRQDRILRGVGPAEEEDARNVALDHRARSSVERDARNLAAACALLTHVCSRQIIRYDQPYGISKTARDDRLVSCCRTFEINSQQTPCAAKLHDVRLATLFIERNLVWRCHSSSDNNRGRAIGIATREINSQKISGTLSQVRGCTTRVNCNVFEIPITGADNFVFVGNEIDTREPPMELSNKEPVQTRNIATANGRGDSRREGDRQKDFAVVTNSVNADTANLNG